jgi:hypothetical protein
MNTVSLYPAPSVFKLFCLVHAALGIERAGIVLGVFIATSLSPALNSGTQYSLIPPPYVLRTRQISAKDAFGGAQSASSSINVEPSSYSPLKCQPMASQASWHRFWAGEEIARRVLARLHAHFTIKVTKAVGMFGLHCLPPRCYKACDSS